MKETSFYKIKSWITHSPLHKPLMECRTKLHDYKVNHTAFKRDTNTIYIVSPYKTGTTYIDSLWEEEISQHEPFQLYSLRDLEKNFEINFYKRETCLDLKLECSGFLSLFLSDLPKSSFQYKYIYILRPPSKWVASVIKHFYGLSSIGYNYINEYYWKRLLSYDMIPLIASGDKEGMTKLVDDLYSLYFKFLDEAYKNSDIYFVKLENIDKLALKLGEKIGTMPNFDKSWKRESKNKLKLHIPLDQKMETEYVQFLDTIPKTRFFPI